MIVLENLDWYKLLQIHQPWIIIHYCLFWSNLVHSFCDLFYWHRTLWTYQCSFQWDSNNHHNRLCNHFQPKFCMVCNREIQVSMPRVETIQEQLVEKLSCFEIYRLFHTLCKWGKKVVISKRESFTATLSRSYIVITLIRKSYRYKTKVSSDFW